MDLTRAAYNSIMNNFYILNRLFNNKELLLVGFGQLITALTGFIFIKLVSHYVSVDQYGRYALALTISGLVGLFPFGIFDQAVSRYIPIYRSKNQYKENYTNVLLINCVWFGMYVLIFAAIKYFFPLVIPLDIRLMLPALILYTLFNTLRNTLLNIENSNRNRGVVIISRTFEGVARITLLLLFIREAFEIKAEGLLNLSAMVFALNIMYVLYRNRADYSFAGISVSKTMENLKCYFVFSMPLFIWAGFGWAQSYLPIWFLKWHDPNGRMYLVGQFAMINTIGALIPSQLVGVISMYIAPIIYQKEPNQPGYAKAIVDKAALYLGMIFLLILITFFFLHGPIMLILTSKQYVPSSWLLPYAFLAAGFLGVGQIWTLELFAYHQTRKLIIANIAPSVVTLLLSYTLIPHWDIVGAVFCILFAGLTYMVLVYIAKNRFVIRLAS